MQTGLEVNWVFISHLENACGLTGWETGGFVLQGPGVEKSPVAVSLGSWGAKCREPH